MKFIKTNSYDIVRLFLNQFALAVFGLVLINATTLAHGGEYGVLTLITGIVSALFYLYILYATTLELGMKDYVKIQTGRLERDRGKGFKMILLSEMPNIILVILMGIGWLMAFRWGSVNDGVADSTVSTGTNMYAICRLIIGFLQAMYSGIIGYFFPGSGVAGDAYAFRCLQIIICYAVSVVPSILVCGISYILGLKNKKLFFGRPPTTDR